MRQEYNRQESERVRQHYGWNLFLLSLCLLALIPYAQADVDLKDGSLHIEHHDISSEDSADTALTRYYHSTADRIGWFGLGWGSTYETRISQTFNGGLALHEHGNGEITYLKPQAGPMLDTDLAIDQMLRAAAANDHALNIQSLRQRLQDDIRFRNRFFSQLLAKEFIRPLTPETGQVFEARHCGCHKIEVSAEGYKYYKNGELTRLFDRQGRMIRLIGENEESTEIEYSLNDIRIQDSHGREIILDVQKDRFNHTAVSRLSSGPVPDISYIYGRSGHLLAVYGQDRERLNYWHGDNGLLFKIRSDQMDDVEISYQSGSGRVDMFNDGIAEPLAYRYRFERREDGARIMKTREWFFYPADNNPPHRQLSHTFLETEDAQLRLGQRTTNSSTLQETVNYAADGLPEEIVRNGKKTTFRYAPESRLLIRKQTPYETIMLSYENEIRKISRISKIRPDNSEVWTAFRYNDSGNLIYAENSHGKTVRLEYGDEGNDRGRIVRMISENEELSFKYNDMAKPIRIAIKGGDALKVSYDGFGEITEINGGGHEAALKITQAFQGLLSLVKPAGVTLSW